MNRRWFQFVILGILAVATITPLLEIFDTWDVIPGPGNDTELGVTALFLGISIAVTIACLIRLAAIGSFSSVVLAILRPGEHQARSAALPSTILRIFSPPLISLRI